MSGLNITPIDLEKVHDINQTPNVRPIPSQNICGICFYNIPQGTLMIVLPGFAMLMIGCILLSMGHADDSWSNDMLRAAMILILLGGLLTLAGLIFWGVMWRKQTPKTVQWWRTSPQQRQVELVAVVNVDGLLSSQGQGRVNLMGRKCMLVETI